jgi:hypothetical protein
MCLDNTDKGREAFSKVNGMLRSAEARSREALMQAMGAALSVVTSHEAKGCFEHRGYRAADQLL